MTMIAEKLNGRTTVATPVCGELDTVGDMRGQDVHEPCAVSLTFMIEPTADGIVIPRRDRLAAVAGEIPARLSVFTRPCAMDLSGSLVFG